MSILKKEYFLSDYEYIKDDLINRGFNIAWMRGVPFSAPIVIASWERKFETLFYMMVSTGTFTNKEVEVYEEEIRKLMSDMVSYDKL